MSFPFDNTSERENLSLATLNKRAKAFIIDDTRIIESSNIIPTKTEGELNKLGDTNRRWNTVKAKHLYGNFFGLAEIANKFKNNIKLQFTGGLIGSATFNGTRDVNINIDSINGNYISGAVMVDSDKTSGTTTKFANATNFIFTGDAIADVTNFNGTKNVFIPLNIDRVMPVPSKSSSINSPLNSTSVGTIGTLKYEFARADHKHPLQVDIEGESARASSALEAQQFTLRSAIKIGGAAYSEVVYYDGFNDTIFDVDYVNASLVTGTASINITGRAKTSTKAVTSTKAKKLKAKLKINFTGALTASVETDFGSTANDRAIKINPTKIDATYLSGTGSFDISGNANTAYDFDKDRIINFTGDATGQLILSGHKTNIPTGKGTLIFNTASTTTYGKVIFNGFSNHSNPGDTRSQNYDGTKMVPNMEALDKTRGVRFLLPANSEAGNSKDGFTVGATESRTYGLTTGAGTYNGTAPMYGYIYFCTGVSGGELTIAGLGLCVTNTSQFYSHGPYIGGTEDQVQQWGPIPVAKGDSISMKYKKGAYIIFVPSI